MPMKKMYYYENATQCGKRMGKPDVATWLNLGYNTQEINLYSSSVAGVLKKAKFFLARIGFYLFNF